MGTQDDEQAEGAPAGDVQQSVPRAPPDVIDRLQRHTMALCVVATRGPKFSHKFFSGSLLDHGGVLYWITAGHVVQELDRLRNDPDIVVRSARWHDFAGSETGAIPTALDGMPMKFVHPDQRDIGLVLLRQHEVDLIRADHRVVPLNTENCRYNEALVHDWPFLVGWPSEWTTGEPMSVGGKSGLTVGARSAIVPIVEQIDPTTQDQSHSFWKHHDCFYGRIRLEAEAGHPSLTSIEGTSGGPIVAVERPPVGEGRTVILGVQCEWLRGQQIIRAEPIGVVLAMIDDLRRQFEAHKKALASGPVAGSSAASSAAPAPGALMARHKKKQKQASTPATASPQEVARLLRRLAEALRMWVDVEELSDRIKFRDRFRLELAAPDVLALASGGLRALLDTVDPPGRIVVYQALRALEKAREFWSWQFEDPLGPDDPWNRTSKRLFRRCRRSPQEPSA